MTYVENIFICLAAPLIIAALCTRGRARRVITFIIIGMAASLVSSYISSFIAAVQGATLDAASLEISPFVEEIIKLVPILFYLIVIRPEHSDAAESCMMSAIGFATYENVCFLLQRGVGNLMFLLIRGFGTGTMHVVCASLVSLGLLRVWKSEWLRFAGTVALLSAAITYHGVFNILVSQTGAPAYVGYFIPSFTALVSLIIRTRHE
ncbi:MAG: PrsW family intramembrane metalloprotease [Lachnospiraceae bacterium]|nr:PrsW family intramembrane metalloprotease [Lachnospiraceae bacterium]